MGKAHSTGWIDFGAVLKSLQENRKRIGLGYSTLSLIKLHKFISRYLTETAYDWDMEGANLTYSMFTKWNASSAYPVVFAIDFRQSSRTCSLQAPEHFPTSMIWPTEGDKRKKTEPRNGTKHQTNDTYAKNIHKNNKFEKYHQRLQLASFCPVYQLWCLGQALKYEA